MKRAIDVGRQFAQELKGRARMRSVVIADVESDGDRFVVVGVELEAKVPKSGTLLLIRGPDTPPTIKWTLASRAEVHRRTKDKVEDLDVFFILEPRSQTRD